MTFDEYNKKIVKINKELGEIAKDTGEQAISGCANMDNPEFAKKIKRQNKLLQDSIDITEEMKGKFNK